MIGKTISHYKIIEKLGGGGMGVVYKAEDTKLKRTVALKFLPPSFSLDDDAKKRFIHEAQAASALEHNNICTIHEIDETLDGQMFIVMSCYEGETLKQKIEKGLLKTDEAIDIAVQVSEGLTKAHEKNIIHRDIKPANIFITSDGVVKILDFGLAKVKGQTQLTKLGSAAGTIDYMSPEQARGEIVDHRTDIWSIGILLYEMITGKAPFKGDYEQAITYSIINEEPEPITGLRTGVPMELENIVNKCLDKNQSNRYQHANELIVDLRRTKKFSKSTTMTSERKKRIFSNRKIFYSIAIVFLLAAVIVLSKYLFFTNSETDLNSKLKMLVVLPFENLGLPEDQYFADGITDEISSLLSNIKSVGVISRKSAFYYANTNATTKKIGEELNVDFIITGTVRWAKTSEGPGRVRVTPRLIQVSNDVQLWAEPFERFITDIFQIQSEIAKKVIEHLDIELMESELKTVESKPTKNLDAYQAYLLARFYELKPHFSIENWLKVVDNYQRAVDLDSTFALAYAKLSKAHSRLFFLRYDISDKRLEMARVAADRALKLAPESAEVHISIGYYYLWALGDNIKALKEWKIAGQVLPNNIDILKANSDVYGKNGEFEKAIDANKKAIILSPRDPTLYLNLALFYWLTRQYEEAIDACNNAAKISPDAEWAYLYKAFIYWSWKGAIDESRIALKSVPPEHEFYYWAWYWQEVGEKNYEKALQVLASAPGEWIRHKVWAIPKSLLAALVYIAQDKKEQSYSLLEKAKILLEDEIAKWPDDPRYHSSLGITYAALGRKNDAIREGIKATELLPISEDAEYGVPPAQDLALIYTLTREYDKAIDQLEYLLKIPSWVSVPYIKIIPEFNSLNDKPKFRALLKKYSR